ncbi:unnamed protein product [Rotaria sp. Silwood2]|nr:unnamed protein product [Rotaria sp. Silwood2]CAF2532490.1 unnamed protein product [Rotaria sp. Silwood2]CAF2784819.1 unnamed protein product [Rotaria sp. Silwood2]CAF2937330.1 unnamed protein product [Rotaria sp. Silwood2]CAF3890556.1 unnamed protein product [Rotaria sp. Silwood2]
MSEAKRFKREFKLIENLPNELFVEIFGYLNGVDTVYAFSQLNIRFQCLLNHYVNNFDFKSISKAKFNYVTQLHDIHQWRSLCLYDDDSTPGQIKYFSRLFPPNEYLHQLKSLTVLHMKPEYAQNFLLQIRSLNNLVSLSIGLICGLNIQSIELTSLKRLILTSCKHTFWIKNFHCLESLQYTIEYNCSHNQNLIFPTTLKCLKVFYEEGRDGSALRTILQQMSQLTRLTLCDNARYSPVPNGKIWEELIQSSLPLLNTFQFFFPFDQYLSTSGDLNQTIESFSTPFYLLEKRWFIRCDRSTTSLFTGALYSLPFAFSRMIINTCSFDMSISTLPISDFDEIKSNYYTKVNTIVFNQECKGPHVGFLSSNIVDLILKVNLPTSWIYLLTKLRHLRIIADMHMSSADFTRLLERAPNLQSLTISIIQLKLLTDKFTNQIVCHQLSQQIQSLTISHHYSDIPNLGIVSVRLLSSLVRIFSMKCQHLSLALMAHPNTVRPILRRMKQLRSLHIQWRYGYIGLDDPIAYWLQQQSTDPTALDFVHTNDKNDLFVWFGNRF